MKSGDYLHGAATLKDATLPEKIFIISRYVDYALMLIFALIALYFSFQSQWGLALLLISSSAVSFLVAKFNIAKRIAVYLLKKQKGN